MHAVTHREEDAWAAEEAAGQFLGLLPLLMHELLVVPYSVLLSSHFHFLECPH